MYIRNDKDCIPTTPPGSSEATDVYGNKFENWCADYKGNDKDCSSNGKSGCADQDPKGLLTQFVFHKYDNTIRVPEQYVESPYIVGSTIFENIDALTIVVLGMEEDRDLVLFRETNQAYLQLESNTQVSSTAVFT